MEQQEFGIKAVVQEGADHTSVERTPVSLPSEELFHQLAESIHEVFWVCTAQDRQFLYVSPAYEKVWGKTCQSLYEDPNSLLEAVVPEDRARLATALAEQSLLPQVEIEYRILRPDQTLRWIRTRTFPVQIQDMDVYRVVGVSQDITDRKLAEKAILEISARERRNIGQDLHDSLLQKLTGIGFMTKALQQRLAQVSAKDATEAAYIGELLQEAIRETRQLARGLNPVQLEAHGLMAALSELTHTTEKLYKIPCVFECEGGIKIHDHDAATHLYRIAQEALSNAMKHSGATQVTLSLLLKEPTHLILKVCDDGKGFPEDVSNDAGMGLHIMNYRARMIGSTLTVQRDIQSGTSVVCSYPYNAA